MPASISRAGFPNGPDAKRWGEQWNEIKSIARAAGRDPDKLVGSMYLTVAVDENTSRADARLAAYLEQYYGQPASLMRARQQCYGGPAAGLAEWMRGYVEAGASHLILRFAGDHERHLEVVAGLRGKLG